MTYVLRLAQRGTARNNGANVVRAEREIYVYLLRSYVYARVVTRVENWIARRTAKRMKAAVGSLDWLSRRAPCGISTNRESGFDAGAGRGVCAKGQGSFYDLSSSSLLTRHRADALPNNSTLNKLSGANRALLGTSSTAENVCRRRRERSCERICVDRYASRSRNEILIAPIRNDGTSYA